MDLIMYYSLNPHEVEQDEVWCACGSRMTANQFDDWYCDTCDLVILKTGEEISKHDLVNPCEPVRRLQ